MREQLRRSVLCLELFSGFADRQGVRLREEVGHELIVIADGIVEDGVGLLRFSEADKLNWSDASLMKELEEAMLSVGAGLPEIHNSSLIGNNFALRVDSFAVALHIQLLNVRSEFA
jgi:hypothetical protein